MSDVSAGGVDDARARALAHLQSIGVRALASNLRRVAELDEAVLLTVTQGELSDQQRSAAVDTAHQLVGSAGTFGYERVSDSARRLEKFFMNADERDERSVSAASDAVRQMRLDLNNGPEDDPDGD